MITSKNRYFELKNSYIKETISHDNLETMVWYKTNNNKKAIIWVPGYNDYYYHFHIGEEMIKNNYDIWALFPHNYKRCSESFYIDDIAKYFLQIDKIIEKMNDFNYDEIILYGHSAGGLTCVSYCKLGKYCNKISKLILNSPFLDFSNSNYSNFLLKYIVYYIGKFFKKICLREVNEDSENKLKDYIMKNYYFSDDFIYNGDGPIYSGWVYTMVGYQTRFQNGMLKTDKPILVISSKTFTNNLDNILGDDVLNVTEFDSWLCKLGSNVTNIKIKKALHDVLASDKQVVDKACVEIFKWLK
tara:strand:+ start:87 stop:986 length:900 start_codon:yes stop_codon:yes gene_type:complete